MYFLILAMGLFLLDIILVIFFGGLRLEFANFTLRSTTIEFPAIGFLISIFSLLIIKRQKNEAVLLALSLLLVCILGEGILRIVDHPLSKPYMNMMSWHEPSDLLGFKMAPNFEGRGPVGSWVRTNSQGFRDVEHQWDKPPGVIRILGLGDSFTFGWGVSLEDSFLKRLESKLKQMTGREIETINAGIPAWGLNHYHVYFREIGVRYSPDIILLSYSFNDVPDSIQEKIPANRTHQRGSEQKGGIFRFSYLFNFTKSLADSVRRGNRAKRIDYLYELDARRKKITESDAHALVYNPGQDQTNASSSIIRTIFKKIQRLATQHHSQLIIMYAPDIAQLQQPTMQHINKVLASLTREMSLPFTDVTPVFESDPDPKTFYFWPRDWHPNPHGHEKIAEALVPIVCQVLQQQDIPCKPIDTMTSMSLEP